MDDIEQIKSRIAQTYRDELNSIFLSEDTTSATERFRQIVEIVGRECGDDWTRDYISNKLWTDMVKKKLDKIKKQMVQDMERLEKRLDALEEQIKWKPQNN